MRKNNSKGFTLIELLVVVLVIGALSGILLGVVNTSGVRGKARDAQRKSDLKKIQVALGLYFADNRVYPTTGGNWERITTGSAIKVALENGGYINPIPTDPTAETSSDSNPCGNQGVNRYNYYSPAGGATYQLTAIMEVTTSNDDSPCGSSITACGVSGSYNTSDFCYLVVNP